MSFQFSTHQSKFFAHHLTSEGIHEEDALAQSLSGAKVDLNPHQVDAATFALRSPLSKGVILADEVGLGKTIEAALVISQWWWKQERNILLIVPASLRKQWATEAIAAYLGLAASAAAIYLIKMGDQQVADQHQACRHKRSCPDIGYLIDARLAARIIKILAD